MLPLPSSASPETSPETSSAPDSPTDLHKRSWKYILTKTVREFGSDQCTDIAASLVYFGVLALFPGLIAVFSLLGVVGQSDAAATSVLEIVQSVAPGGTADLLRGPIEEIASSPAAGFALVSGLVLAVWSASGYVRAFGRGMNRIYEIDEGRPFWKLVPAQLLLTLVTVVLVTLAALLLVVSGPVAEAVGDALGLGEAVVLTWNIAKWPVLVGIIVLILAILYYGAPNAKQPRFRWISVGAVVAIVILAIATAGFGLYVSQFSNYDRTYGSLAGVIVFLLWLWIANIAILFGAELDAELERGRQLQAGIPAERELQLPPRDTTKIDKAREVEAKDVAEGRRLRESGGHDDPS